jgi:hypothetical protein
MRASFATTPGSPSCGIDATIADRSAELSARCHHLSECLTCLRHGRIRSWPVQDARARLGEVLEAFIADGSDMVTKRRTDAAALGPVAQSRHLEAAARPLLCNSLRFEMARADAPDAAARQRPPTQGGRDLARMFPPDTTLRRSCAGRGPTAPSRPAYERPPTTVSAFSAVTLGASGRQGRADTSRCRHTLHNPCFCAR